MKRSFLAAALVAIVVAATPASARVLAAPDTPSLAEQQSLYAPPRVLVHYGHIKSLVRKGSRFELRFDPALWLGGTTANRAAIEDKVIPPGDTVPNDYYIRDETHRLLTYRVPPGARVTVIAQGNRSIRVTVAELAQIVKGKNPTGRPLYDRQNHLGYWIRVATDTVRSLDQQYQP